MVQKEDRTANPAPGPAYASLRKGNISTKPAINAMADKNPSLFFWMESNFIPEFLTRS